MTRKQKLELRAGDIRKRLAGLSALDELTDEHRTEIGTLRAEYADVETQIAAATIGEDEPTRTAAGAGDGEERELNALRGRVELRNYIAAAIEKRGAEGAEGEFNAALNIGAHRFPLEVLAPSVEVRATTATDAGPTQPRRWLDRVFADTAASAIGVTMEAVAPGIASFPMTTAGPTAAQRGKEEAIADAAWTIAVEELKPVRNGVRVLYTSEDALRNPGLEDALRRDLRAALTEGIDRAIFLGDSTASGTDADIVGFTTASIGETTITQANKVKGSNVLEAFANLIDGKHAASPGDLRTVLTVGAMRLWMHQLANTGNAVDTTILEFLNRAGINYTSRGELETATADGDFGAFVGLGRGIEGAAVAPVWSDGMMIVDPYTGAAKGQTAITLAYHWNFAFVREANFKRIKFAA